LCFARLDRFLGAAFLSPAIMHATDTTAVAFTRTAQLHNAARLLVSSSGLLLCNKALAAEVTTVG